MLLAQGEVWLITTDGIPGIGSAPRKAGEAQSGQAVGSGGRVDPGVELVNEGVPLHGRKAHAFPHDLA